MEATKIKIMQINQGFPLVGFHVSLNHDLLLTFTITNEVWKRMSAVNARLCKAKDNIASIKQYLSSKNEEINKLLQPI